MRRLTGIGARCAVALICTCAARAQTSLPGTQPLTDHADFAARMVDSINAFLEQQTAHSAAGRPSYWRRNYASRADYEQSTSENREKLRKIIGAVDPRVHFADLELVGTLSSPALVSSRDGYKAYAVRWPVLDGVTGEGILLQPDRPPIARIVALPDADTSPEMLAGLTPGLEPEAQFGHRLAANGCMVLIPVLLDRKDDWSGIPGIRYTNQPHREWIYRMAYEVGRHIIGYEVQKVLAAVDWFAQQHDNKRTPIAVAGYGEGGLIAFYSGALDRRIDATLVSGYFGPREELWREPVYRDVWGLLREFGDAEIASLIAPRALIIEAARSPQITGPPEPTAERSGATPNGKISTPPLQAVEHEIARTREFYKAVGADGELHLAVSGNGNGPPGSGDALQALLTSLDRNLRIKPLKPAELANIGDDGRARAHRQFRELVEYTQALVRESPSVRAAFWSKADRSSPQRWNESTKFYRDYIWDEVIGRLPAPNVPANPRTRLVYDEPKFRGYEVELDVWPGIFAYGILLVPRNITAGQRFPVVVCQHGLEGRPQDVADPRTDSHYYHRFAVKLAEQGFVTFSPQNPYIGEDRFRIIQRKAHPLKLALFAFILGQHQRILEWLAAQPFVDPRRIGFYGLSYGGKTAVRVPPLLDGYALSICSADFNEWVWKNTSIDSKYSYLLTREYDMIEFDFANVANYSDLASLMAPRPFMVERGHGDEVAPDEWVAYEYAKVRRLYDQLGIPERTEIEFFNGPHTINGKGTFEFLRKHLQPSER
jgi:dienelactone hydrolase